MVVEDFRTSPLLRLLSHEDGDIDEEDLVRCSSNGWEAAEDQMFF